MLHDTLFLENLGSLRVDKNILNKSSAIPYDLQLNMLWVLVEAQRPFGSREDLDPAKLIHALYRPCVDRTGGETNAFLDASAGMCMSLKMNCFYHSPCPKNYAPDIFLQVLW
jgi:hypothetical protein